MSTIKTRINVSLSNQVKAALSKLAARDQVPTATKAERLLELALEIEEDEVWNQIASSRDSEKTSYVSHNKAWK